MSIIEMLDTAGFTEYLKKYGNTICGRHPIGVLLNVRNILYGQTCRLMQDLMYYNVQLLISIFCFQDGRSYSSIHKRLEDVT
jgi:predicted class III extradiol MEMO1 family dioxygenase